MQPTILFGLAAFATTVAAACTANNCARAVTGTAAVAGKPGIASRRADCSSFLIKTVFTDSSGSSVGQQLPTAVPSYASACTTNSPQSAYSSACSCFGITATTTQRPPEPTTCVHNSDIDYPCPAPRGLCSCLNDETGKPYCVGGYGGDGSMCGSCSTGYSCYEFNHYCYPIYPYRYCQPAAAP